MSKVSKSELQKLADALTYPDKGEPDGPRVELLTAAGMTGVTFWRGDKPLGGCQRYAVPGEAVGWHAIGGPRHESLQGAVDELFAALS